MNSIGVTSRWTAAARARESAREDRLFDDPFAAALAGDEGFAYLDRMNRAARTELPFVAFRTRFFDDALLAEANAGARQIVLLAAGMDARAFRLRWPSDTRIFELDQAAVLETKTRCVGDAEPTASRTTLGVDLREAWEPELLRAGFDPARRSAFLLEGFLSYLPPDAVHAFIDRIGALVASGGWLGADFSNRASLELDRARLKTLAVDGAPVHFAEDDPKGLFDAHGWDAMALRPGDDGANWNARWPHRVPPKERRFPQTFFVSARRR